MVVLTSEAQYKKLTRGQPMPYDTGVAVEIGRYRVEGEYMKRFRIVMDSLNFEAKLLTKEIDSLTFEISVKDSLRSTQAKQFNVLKDGYKKQAETVNKLSYQFDKLYEEKNKWTWKDWGLLAALIYIAAQLSF